MSPLIFVRDGRTLPWIPVSQAALDAIRNTCAPAGEDEPKRNLGAARSTYLALLELANEDRADRVATSQKAIIERTGFGRTAVQQALQTLVEARVLEVAERRHNAVRLENEYVVVEPPESTSEATPPPATRATPARYTGSSRAGETSELLEGTEEPSGGSQEELIPDERAQRFCAYLADELEKRRKTRPRITPSWVKAAREILALHSSEEIRSMLAFAFGRDYWSSRVKTMPLFAKNRADIALAWSGDKEAQARSTSRRLQQGGRDTWEPNLDHLERSYT